MTLDDIFPFSSAPHPREVPSDEALEDVAAEASGSIQLLQNLVGREDREAARIRFPRGYLREIGRWRLALAFVRTSTVRSNIAYTLMMHDVQAWVLKRTDLAGPAQSMLAKAAMAALGGVAEALLVDATTPPMGHGQRVASRITRLCEGEVIDAALVEDLSWLWEIRNRQHLSRLVAREIDVYTPDDHPRAEATVAGLIHALHARAEAPAA